MHALAGSRDQPVLPAFSLAFVGLVQGAAIGQSVPNPDGTYPDPSGDFRGQGVANIVSGVMRGMPVGGSMSATSLVIAAGGHGRYANLIAGAVMVMVIILFGPAAGLVAMPSLAALLMLDRVPHPQAGPGEDGVADRFHPGAVMATTFVLTLLVPMQYAVMIGVGISVILFVAKQSNRVTIKRWEFEGDSQLPHETVPPAVLPPGEVVVLTPYGSLFFASASVFESQLPVPEPGSIGSVVVLRMRGKEDLGSTFINTIVRYNDSVSAVGSHLVLAGIGERVLAQLTNTGALDRIGTENVFVATHKLGESLQAGLRRARELQEAGSDDQHS